MRTMIGFASLVCALVFSYQAMDSQSREHELGNDRDEILIRRIQAGDGSAISEAGRTGNRIFVPYLRQQLRRRSHHTDTAGAARVALAKLGQTDQLQQEWCNATSEDPNLGFDGGILELGSVGGWFAIQGLQKFLTGEEDGHYFKAAGKRKHAEDMMALPPAHYALQTLTQLVPNAPVKFNAFEMPSQIKIWQDWIAAHKDELSKLQPTGEGVDFSPNARKNGKPRKKR
jgi:hypothetical protein